MFQINQNCVGCHNCASECPVQAIDWVGKKYEIDQDKCVQCGLCFKVCHTCSVIDTEEPAPVPHAPVELEADLVVCGAGSGLVSAVKAAMDGKKVILVEKARKIGGNTDYAHGFFPVYTKWYEEAGMPDCREEAVTHYMNATNGILGEDVIRTAVYKTGEFFDWMCTLTDCHKYYHLVNLGSVDAHGPIFGPGLLDFPSRQFDNLNCRDDAIGPGWGGTFVKYAMLGAIEKLGLDVTIYTETEAKHLLLDDAGAICGLICRDPGGEVRIRAQAVVLATGGFGKADDLLDEFYPGFLNSDKEKHHRFSVPTDTGDGIRMLRELGVEPLPDRLFISQFGPKHHPFSNILADIELEPEMLEINLDGKRWVDETGHLMGMTALINDQPRAVSWAVQTRANMKMVADRFINNPAFASKRNLYETWEEELKEESELPIPPCAIADTLDELAEKIGCPADALKATIARYNADCEAGCGDTEFGKKAEHMLPLKEGPYYAIWGARFSEASMGGLMVDGDCRVLRNDGSFIPGLYGVGDATSAMHRRGELAVISELTWAVASAYTSGLNAAAYIEAKGGVQ